MFPVEPLREFDPEIWAAIENEKQRQEDHIELIASENYVSPTVLAVQGSVLTNKYAEGYPDKRYYGGCEFVDIAEKLAIQRAKQLFGADYANVQPHSGSQANSAAYAAMIQPGDVVLGMNLAHGGRVIDLHGSPVIFRKLCHLFAGFGILKPVKLIMRKQAVGADKPKINCDGFSAFTWLISAS